MDEKIVESWLAEIQQVIHSIGLAAFAKVEASLLVYLKHILGVTSGRGPLYAFCDKSRCL